MSDREPTYRGRTGPRVPAPAKLTADVVEAVLLLQRAVRHHEKMVEASASARTPMDREDAWRHAFARIDQLKCELDTLQRALPKAPAGLS